MEFKIDKKQFENALTRLNPYLEKKDMGSTVANVYIEVQGLELILNATNYEFGLKLNIAAIQDGVDGKILANGTDLLNIVKRLKDGTVHLIANDKELTVKQGRSKLRLDCLPTSDYPSLEIRNYENMKELTFDTKILYEGIKCALFSIDANNPKYELQCLLLDFDDTLKIVSTDTRCLTLYDTEVQVLNKDQLLIPKTSIVEIQKIMLNDCKVYFDDVHLVMESDGMRFFTKLINGKFPQYQRIIPQQLINDFTVPLKEFVSSVKLVTALDNIIRVTFSSGNIHIESAGEERKPSETDIEHQLNINEPITIKLNATQVLNALSNINSDVFSFGINEPTLPLLIYKENYKVINMPVIEFKRD